VCGTDVRKEHVFPGRAIDRARTLRSGKTYLYESDALIDFIGRVLPVDTFEQLALPFAAMTVDV